MQPRSRPSPLDLLDMTKDVDHIDDVWYKEKLQGDAQDINDATRYLLKEVLPKAGIHFFRGSVIGALVGYGASWLTDDPHIISRCSIVLGCLDTFQFGVRATIKLGRTYL